MSTAGPSEAKITPPSPRHWSLPRLEPERRWIGGVATGIASEVGVDALLVRAALVALTLFSPIWPILYVLSYLVLLVLQGRSPEPRPQPAAKARDTAQRHIGFACVAVGLAPLSAIFGDVIQISGIMPAGLVLMGATLAWSRGGASATSPTLRLAIGMLAVVVGLVVLLTSQDGGQVWVQLAGLVVVIAIGLGLLSGPWLYHTAQQLNEERAARIRADEKSQIATHLHDSVLQTLALIQKNAEDPARTLALARRQERQLRDWLYGPDQAPDGAVSFRALLGTIVDEVEEMHGTAIESVVVGDIVVDEQVASVLRAAREAMVNAAKHSGASRIDVFAELSRTSVEVFVRDSGAGFDPEGVDELRRGISDSIQARMDRLGGTAAIHTELGEGTEVELVLRRETVRRPQETEQNSGGST